MGSSSRTTNFIPSSSQSATSIQAPKPVSSQTPKSSTRRPIPSTSSSRTTNFIPSSSQSATSIQAPKPVSSQTPKSSTRIPFLPTTSSTTSSTPSKGYPSYTHTGN